MNETLPWRYSKLREFVGHRYFLLPKFLFDRSRAEQLMSAYQEGRKLLFVHIPKTGGVSLIKAYEPFFAEARHRPVLVYKAILGKNFSKFKTFSVVRNPWARVFSAYDFLKRGGLGGTDQKMGKILHDECPTFERFIKEWLPENGVCSYGHFIPQYEFLCGFGKQPIIDYVLKLERLADEVPVVVESLGLPKIEIPRLNASGKANYQEHYDDESSAIVWRLYRTDIALLGYTFED